MVGEPQQLLVQVRKYPIRDEGFNNLFNNPFSNTLTGRDLEKQLNLQHSNGTKLPSKDDFDLSL